MGGGEERPPAFLYPPHTSHVYSINSVVDTVVYRALQWFLEYAFMHCMYNVHTISYMTAKVLTTATELLVRRVAKSGRWMYIRSEMAK